jgi:hypothetical protein
MPALFSRSELNAIRCPSGENDGIESEAGESAVRLTAAAAAPIERT